MKKIFYIVPILVFAMVVLSQDAKAQQTGNGSDVFTQQAASAASKSAVNITGAKDNTDGPKEKIGDGTSATSIVITATPIYVKVFIALRLSQQEINATLNVLKAEIATAAGVAVSRVSITTIEAG